MAGTRVLCPKHPKHSKERSYSSLPLGQWDSETRPFCCSDKTFILKSISYLSWIQTTMVFYFQLFCLFCCFPWELSWFWSLLKPCPWPKCKIWSADDMVKIFCHSQHMIMYIHNILNLFMISINASIRLEQLIQWKYVQIICSTVIYHSSQMSEMNTDCIRFGPACVIYSKAPIH